MPTPKVCGMDVEYGILAADPDTLSQAAAARALLLPRLSVGRLPWNPDGELPVDVRSDNPIEPTLIDPERLPQPDTDSAFGYLLANGARLYVDHGHPEYATPECLRPEQVVAADKAGELILNECREIVNSILPVGQSISLFKNNSDGKGNSYGTHENYLMAADVYDELFRREPARLEAHLIPFLVSRQVICGAGKVGIESGTPGAGYQISQRADFFETVYGLQTMVRRPLVNTRNEPHANRARYRRLHVIIGDSNMAELSGYLKIGTTQIVLAMLEDGAKLPALRLENPVRCLKEISYDVDCRRTVRLADGRGITAVEIQRAFAEAAGQYVRESPELSAYTAVVERWMAALDALADDPMRLSTQLDWVIKLHHLRGQNKGWDAPETRAWDLRYHDINRETSIFYILQEAGQIERLLTDADINGLAQTPPPDTRAADRAGFVAASGEAALSGGWEAVVYRDESGRLQRRVFPEPLPARTPVKQSQRG